MSICMPTEKKECPTCERDMALHVPCSYSCGRYICPDEDGRIMAYEPNDSGVRRRQGWVCMTCITEDAKRHGAKSVDDFIKGIRFCMQKGDL